MTTLKRGVVAGLIAGAVAGLFHLVLSEPVLQRAINLEPPGGHEMFTRSTQHAGLVVGNALYGVALGALFALVYAVLEARSGPASPWDRSLHLAAAGFAAWMIPFLKYPTNPPGIGDPATIGARTAAYLAMIAISVGTLVGARVLARSLERRGTERHVRHVLVGAGFVAVIVLAWAVLPDSVDVGDVPAAMLWQARAWSAAGQAVLWAVLGTAFGLLSVRTHEPVLAA